MDGARKLRLFTRYYLVLHVVAVGLMVGRIVVERAWGPLPRPSAPLWFVSAFFLATSVVLFNFSQSWRKRFLARPSAIIVTGVGEEFDRADKEDFAKNATRLLWAASACAGVNIGISLGVIGLIVISLV